MARNPELLRYITCGPWASLEIFEEWYDRTILRDPTIVWYAVYNKAQKEGEEDEFAGVIGLLNTSKQNAMTEVGHVRFSTFSLPLFPLICAYGR